MSERASASESEDLGLLLALVLARHGGEGRVDGRVLVPVRVSVRVKIRVKVRVKFRVRSED